MLQTNPIMNRGFVFALEISLVIFESLHAIISVCLDVD